MQDMKHSANPLSNCGAEAVVVVIGRVLLYNLCSIGGVGEVEQFISRFSPTFTARSRSVIKRHYN